MTELIPNKPGGEILLYQTEDGRSRIEVRMQAESVWLSLNQMAELFQRDKSVISRHVKGIFNERELQPEAVVAKFATTAAEIVHQRADSSLPHMGLTSWPGTRPRLEDAEVAKNYLTPEELDTLNRIVTAYLEFAELQALNRQPMYMGDWAVKMDEFLRLSGRQLLDHAGSISHEEALEKARAEYEKYCHAHLNDPSPVEEHFLQAAKEVQRLSGRKKRGKKKGDVPLSPPTK